MAIRPARRQRPGSVSTGHADPKQRTTEHPERNIGVSELATDTQGALSPYGEGRFPLPLRAVRYRHPGQADRPRLTALDERSGSAE